MMSNRILEDINRLGGLKNHTFWVDNENYIHVRVITNNGTEKVYNNVTKETLDSLREHVLLME